MPTIHDLVGEAAIPSSLTRVDGCRAAATSIAVTDSRQCHTDITLPPSAAATAVPTWQASRSRWLLGALWGGKFSRNPSAVVHDSGSTLPLHAAAAAAPPAALVR
jgi:hypothetical protein